MHSSCGALGKFVPHPSDRSAEDDLRLKAMGERIAQARDCRRLSQRQLSEASNVDIKTIARIERGLISPGALTLIAIAQALELPIEYMMLGAERVRYNEPQTASFTPSEALTKEAHLQRARINLLEARVDLLESQVKHVHNKH